MDIVPEFEVKLDIPSPRDWVRFEGTVSGFGMRFEGAEIGIRLGFLSRQVVPAESNIRVKVLGCCGLLGLLAVSKVLVIFRLAGGLVVGVGELDFKAAVL